MEKIKVYFNLRASSRERMWDTAREAKRVCEPLLPQIEKQTSIVRNEKRQKQNIFLRRLKRFLFRQSPLLNYQSVSDADKADLFYMWGAFPKDTQKSFILELDNPFVLTYYNLRTFKLRHKRIIHKLREAKQITYLSATARNHALELFGQEFAGKSQVFPPFMEQNYKRNNRPPDNIVRFLFVGLGFRRKGLPEVLQAFSRLSQQNVRLTVISDTSQELQQSYKNDGRITFLPPQTRETLFKKYYSTHDVFVMPSLLESLGVVLLEALSFGMGIITTDLYATPELVQNTKNGILIEHPFLKHTKLNNVPTIDCVSIQREYFEEKYIHNVPLYNQLVDALESSLHTAMTDYKVWQEISLEHFETTYAPTIWENRLDTIINAASE